MIPNEREELVYATKSAIDAYIDDDHRLGSKYGESNVMSIVSPLQFSHQGTHGAFMYCDQLINKKDVCKMHWFNQTKGISGKKLRNIQLLAEQTMIVDYPLLAYRGFAPDNREIILVNLADQEHP